MKRAENCLYDLQETTQLERKPSTAATFYPVLQNLETLLPSLFIHGFLQKSWKQPKSTKRKEQYLIHTSASTARGGRWPTGCCILHITCQHRRRCTRYQQAAEAQSIQDPCNPWHFLHVLQKCPRFIKPGAAPPMYCSVAVTPSRQAAKSKQFQIHQKTKRRRHGLGTWYL